MILKNFLFSILNVESLSFELQNLVIEIKSSYYYNLHKEINILKKEQTINSGFNYLMILDKKYDKLLHFLEIFKSVNLN